MRTTPLFIIHRRRNITRALAIFVLGAAGLVATPAVATAGTGQVIYVALVNPSANITPNPNFLSGGSCTGSVGSVTCSNPCVNAQLTWAGSNDNLACSNYVLQSINNARASLGETALTLPSNWMSLTSPQQLFVIADMERVVAGYPPYLGLNDALSAEAQTAANNNADPGLAPGFDVGNNPWSATGFDGAWAGTDNVLMADYFWMYDDGWGGSTTTTSNIACTGPDAFGCWGHRDELLGSTTDPHLGVGLGCTTCVMGAASGTGATGSVVDLIELPAASPVAMSFTWAQELTFFPSMPTPATPTVDPHGGPAPIGKVTGHVVSWNTHGLTIAWALSSGATFVTVVIPSMGLGCHTAIGPVQQITHGVQHGVITVPFVHHFGYGVHYSALVEVGVNSGLVRGPCLALAPLHRPARHHNK